MSRRGGIISLKVDGQQLDAKGNFTYSGGEPVREGLAGSDGVHGFKETVRVPFIEGEITDRADLDVSALKKTENATVTIQLANGKVFVLRNAWFAGESTGNTEEGNLNVRFEGLSGEEIN